MKNLLTALLPALALFALGGCAGTSALATSEDDGVYYSSKDRTTAVASATTVPAGANEAANPDYNGGPASAPARRSGSDQYYDNTYIYMRGVPSYGVTTYVPYSPYTVLSYGAGYGWGGGYGGFPPYSYLGYDPFFSPFGYGYGSGISINIGYGRPWGYGGGYGRPYGYGYGGGFYDPFYYSSPFYGGYYGRGGYGGGYYGSNYGYGGGYGGYGGNQYNTGGTAYGNDNGRTRTSGHRTDRASDGRYSAGSGGGSVPVAPVGNGRVRSERVMVAPGPDAQPMPTAGNGNEGGRSRTETVAESLTPPPGRAEQPYNQPRRLDSGEEPRYRNMEPNADQGQRAGDDGRGRWRTAEAQPQREQAQPQEGQRRRGGFFQNVFSEPAGNGNGGQAAEQPARERAYDQPRQQRAYEPQQQQRSYEQPLQRSYEQPQQRSYSQPSYSAPSNGGGGGGGGHSRGRVE